MRKGILGTTIGLTALTIGSMGLNYSINNLKEYNKITDKTELREQLPSRNKDLGVAIISTIITCTGLGLATRGLKNVSREYNS